MNAPNDDISYELSGLHAAKVKFTCACKKELKSKPTWSKLDHHEFENVCQQVKNIIACKHMNLGYQYMNLKFSVFLSLQITCSFHWKSVIDVR